jgi:hypothetical protein
MIEARLDRECAEGPDRVAWSLGSRLRFCQTKPGDG